MEKVEKNTQSSIPNHFNVWIAPDCAKTSKETQLRTWFYFSVTGVYEKITLTFTIKNMNFQ